MVSTVSMVGFDVIDGFDGVELKLRTLMPIRLDGVDGVDGWLRSYRWRRRFRWLASMLSMDSMASNQS
eukprot:scaffold27981_cov37-Cyclotella_meneghiniana.AAC.2